MSQRKGLLAPRGENNRRVISFEEDIIADVYEKLGGAYSESDIRSVYRAMVNASVCQIRFGDATEVTMHPLGYLTANLGHMKARLGKLDNVYLKNGYYLTPFLKMEYAKLKEKIAYYERVRREKGKRKKTDWRFLLVKLWRSRLKKPLPLPLLEDFQDGEYYRKY